MEAIILAAGQATRMRPLSYYVPKILLPVKGVPVLKYLLENLARISPRRTYIVASEKLDVIQNYVSETGTKRVEVVRGLGWETGGDLSIGIEHIGPTSDVVVTNGDIVTDINLTKVVDAHKSTGSDLTIAVFRLRDRREARRFGRIEMDKTGRITKFAEKSETTANRSNLVNTGFYIFGQNFLKNSGNLLRPRRFRLEEELFPEVARQGRLHGCLAELSYWWDVGTMDSYLKAENYMINKRGIIPP